MRVLFTYGDASYTLVMSPDTGGTGTAKVSCTNWSAYVGSYSLSFNVTLTHP